MLKKRAYLFLLLISSLAYSQSEISEIEYSFFSPKDRYVTANILAPVSPVLPRIRVGYMQHINEKLMFGINTGFVINGMYKKHYDAYKLFELRPELYYNWAIGKRVTHYLSFELFHVWHQEVMHNGTYLTDNGGEISYSKADFQRLRYGYHFKYGMLLLLDTNFGINWYIGLGEALKITDYYNLEDAKLSTAAGHGHFFRLGGIEGEYKELSFAFGFRFFYKF